jgi:hypothetical protein
VSRWKVRPRSPVYRIRDSECRFLENHFFPADSDVSDGKRTCSAIVRASRVKEVVANAAQCLQGIESMMVAQDLLSQPHGLNIPLLDVDEIVAGPKSARTNDRGSLFKTR